MEWSRGRLPVLALVALAVLSVGVADLVGLGPGDLGFLTPDPCDDDFTAEAPQAAVAFSYDAANGTLAVGHAGGDPFRATGEQCVRTGALVVVVTGSDRATRDRVLWAAANGSGVASLPVERGDALALAESEGTGPADAGLAVELREGDAVRVVWYQRRGRNEATLGTCTVGASDPGGDCRRDSAYSSSSSSTSSKSAST